MHPNSDRSPSDSPIRESREEMEDYEAGKRKSWGGGGGERENGEVRDSLGECTRLNCHLFRAFDEYLSCVVPC